MLGTNFRMAKIPTCNLNAECNLSLNVSSGVDVVSLLLFTLCKLNGSYHCFSVIQSQNKNSECNFRNFISKLNNDNVNRYSSIIYFRSQRFINCEHEFRQAQPSSFSLELTECNFKKLLIRKVFIFMVERFHLYSRLSLLCTCSF